MTPTVIPGVQHDRRVRNDGHDPERRSPTTVSEVRYITAAQNYEALREQMYSDFGFGRVEVAVDGRVLVMDGNAQKILNFSWFSGSAAATYLRQIVPTKYARMHDAEVPDNVLHKWVESDEIVRSLGKANRLQIEDPESGALKTILVSLTRPTRPDAVATATLIEEKIAAAATGSDIHWSKGTSTLIATLKDNFAIAALLCVTLVLCFAFAALAFNGYWTADARSDALEASRERFRGLPRDWLQNRQPGPIELHKPPSRAPAPESPDAEETENG